MVFIWFFLLLLILPMLFYSLFWKRNKTMGQKNLTERRFAKMNAKISLPLLIFMIFCFLDFLLLSKLVFPNFVVRKQFLNQGSNTFLKSDFKLFCFWLHFEINTTIMFIFYDLNVSFSSYVLLKTARTRKIYSFPPFCQNITICVDFFLFIFSVARLP